LSIVGWNSCPVETEQQVQHLLAELTKQLEGNLVGIYLHGSLALGCFNPSSSDIDLLVLTERKISIPTKKALVQLLLSISGLPHAIEISFLCQGNLTSWIYPTPFELHYSEEWRERFREDLISGNWKHLGEQPQTDTDLAAHFTVTRHRGICLWGTPPEKVFPDIPPKDFLASVVSDLEWTLERLDQISVTGVLNSCRTYAYLQERRICSKEEGAVWAFNVLPVEFHPVVERALAIYRGERSEQAVNDLEGAKHLIEYVIALARAAGYFSGATKVG
jgi:predicted nucleotidyltransferase